MPSSGGLARAQAHTFLELWAGLAPLVRTDRAFPSRLEQRLRQTRRFGSRDRRLYRELSYTVLRYLPWLESGLTQRGGIEALVWLAADLPAVQPLKWEFTRDWPALPPTMEARARIVQEKASLACEASLLPAWFESECPVAFDSPTYDVLQQRAPLWIRLQTERVEAVADELTRRGWQYRVSETRPHAWQLMGEIDVTQTEAYEAGLFEVQDLGSQTILDWVAPERGERWLDACAGAGGKTLQLARCVGPKGVVHAHDIRSEALEELVRRAHRAGLTNTEVIATATGIYDGVLVDAPCTGTGTWRRAPHLKWWTRPHHVREASDLQISLLRKFASHVRPGGRLVYATCSLCRTENEAVAEAFLATTPGFQPLPLTGAGVPSRPDAPAPTQQTLLPDQRDSDGFFVAQFRRD